MDDGVQVVRVGAGAENVSAGGNFPRAVGLSRENDELPVSPSRPGLTVPDEFSVFMRSHEDMVFATAARLTGNAAQAEDIAQEVFLRAFTHFTELRTSPAAGGWLRTVATNLSLNHLSRYRKRWRFFSELRREDGDGGEATEVEFPAPDTLLAGIEAGERRRLVERALAQLPDRQRVPLVLYHFEDLSYEEIARRLGVSLAKVKTDIFRARTALARILAAAGTAHDHPLLSRP